MDQTRFPPANRSFLAVPQMQDPAAQGAQAAVSDAPALREGLGEPPTSPQWIRDLVKLAYRSWRAVAPCELGDIPGPPAAEFVHGRPAGADGRGARRTHLGQGRCTR